MPKDRPTSQRSTRVILLVATIAVVFLGCYFARAWVAQNKTNTSTPSARIGDYQRIIGLSPSIVEIIYQLEKKDKLVGVSRFCNYPPEAKEKTVVGGYVDLDYEAVLALRPDCVVLLEEQRTLAEKLESMGIHTIIVDHASTQGVIESISILGKAFHQQALSDDIVHATQNPNLKENNMLIVWILLFVFVSGIGQLVYWIVEIIGKRKTAFGEK